MSMSVALYDAAVADINSKLSLAGISTVTFSREADKTVNSVHYNYLLKYTGYHLESQSQTLYKALFEALAKYGEWVTLKAVYAAISLPSNPATDHYVPMYGNYVSQLDVAAPTVEEDALNTALRGATEEALNKFKNIGTSRGYTLNSFAGSYSIGALDGSKNRALAVSIAISLHDPLA